MRSTSPARSRGERRPLKSRHAAPRVFSSGRLRRSLWRFESGHSEFRRDSEQLEHGPSGARVVRAKSRREADAKETEPQGPDLPGGGVQQIDGRARILVGVAGEGVADLVEAPTEIRCEEVADIRRLAPLLVQERETLEETLSGWSCLKPEGPMGGQAVAIWEGSHGLPIGPRCVAVYKWREKLARCTFASWPDLPR